MSSSFQFNPIVLTSLLSGLIVVIAMAIPVNIFSQTSIVAPNLFYIVLFFWLLKAREFMPFIALLFFGFLQDLLYGEYLGLNMLSNIVFFLLLDYLSVFLYKRPFQILWLVFAGLVILSEGIKFLIYSFSLDVTEITFIWILKILLTVLLYPVGFVILEKIYRTVSTPRHGF